MSVFRSLERALLCACTVALLGAYHAGVRSFTFAAPAVTAQLGVRSSTVQGVVWYPASQDALEAPQSIGSDRPVFEAGRAAPDAPIAGGKRFPLILLSHGTGGSAMRLAWLGPALARAGYVAVAIDHPGNNDAEKTVQGFVMWWLRPVALSLALDRMLADPVFGPHLDAKRIGAAGFSIGAFTVLGLAGAAVDESQFHHACDANPSVCDAPPEFPNLILQLKALMKSDPAFAAKVMTGVFSESDPRVRSVYAIAPAVASSVPAASLRAIRIPVRIAYGSNDTTVPPAYNAKYYAAQIPAATLVVLPGAAHYTFLDTCTAFAVGILPRICTDAQGVDRDAVHAQVAADAAAFFERTLGP